MNKYSYTVTWSERDDSYIALCPEFPGISGIGDTIEEAIAELQVALELVIEIYQEEGRALPEPQLLENYNGKVLVRMPKSLHHRLTHMAELEGISLNTLIVAQLSEAMGVNNGISRIQRAVSGFIRDWQTYAIGTASVFTKAYDAALGNRTAFDVTPSTLSPQFIRIEGQDRRSPDALVSIDLSAKRTK